MFYMACWRSLHLLFYAVCMPTDVQRREFREIWFREIGTHLSDEHADEYIEALTSLVDYFVNFKMEEDIRGPPFKDDL